MGLLERLRAQPAWKDPDPQVRRSALRQTADPAILIEMRRTDPDAVVRDAAAAALLDLAMEGADETVGVACVGAIEDSKEIVQVARSSRHEPVSLAALARLHEIKALGSVARHGRHAAARLEALDRLLGFPGATGPIRDELATVVLKSPHDDAALSAFEHLCGSDRFALPGPAAGGLRPDVPDTAFLQQLAEHGKSRAAVRRARALLHDRQASADAGSSRPRTNRRPQLRLCEEAESLARSAECEPLAARILALQDSWTDLVPRVDDDLDERFQAALQAARDRQRANVAARDERQQGEERVRALREAHIAPRLAIIAAAERAEGTDTPRLLEDACWEWNRLEPPDEVRPVDMLETEVLAEARALGTAFDAARKASQCRYEKWLQDLDETRRREETEKARLAAEESRRQEAGQKRDNLTRLEKLCERGERLVKLEGLTLKKAGPLLRELRIALDETPPLPSRRDQERIVDRLKGIRAGLVPRTQEMRDAEKWKRWANTNVQEELCARAEALKEITDPEAAARRLPDLLERWKTAAEAEPDKSQELWLRFKAAADEVRARQEALHAANAARKVDLCVRAEAIAESTDWMKTAESIKALQAEWKTVGQAGRGQEKPLWERFRQACDRFFTQRDASRDKRREEWSKNLELREGLCARAESMADSTDWQGAASDLKKLQADWKAAGPVRPNRSEALWRRFRGACDRFFERYKRRDEIDRERHLTERGEICRELEALIPSAGPGEPPAPPADGPPPDVMTTVETAWTRWQKAPVLPRADLAPLLERFQSALDRLIAAHPESVRGTAFDTGANRSKMEEICARLEKLLSSTSATGDESLSPATRLATLWREKMASNTIGGKVAEEAKQRASSEEVRKAQAIWQKIGYVPDPDRRALTERFERACRTLAPQPDRPPATPRSPKHSPASSRPPSRSPAARGRR